MVNQTFVPGKLLSAGFQQLDAPLSPKIPAYAESSSQYASTADRSSFRGKVLTSSTRERTISNLERSPRKPGRFNNRSTLKVKKNIIDKSRVSPSRNVKNNNLDDADLDEALKDLNKIKKYYQNEPETTVKKKKEVILPAQLSLEPSIPESDSGLKNKLEVMESLLRKLYHKNVSLEKQLKEQSAKAGQSNESRINKFTNSIVEEEELKKIIEPESDVLHLHRVVEEKERVISKLEKSVQELQNEIENSKESCETTMDSILKKAKEETDTYKSQYIKLLKENKKLTESLSKSVFSRNQKQNKKLIVSTLEESLARQKRDHEVEMEALNRKIDMVEQENCNWYVEKRILEEKLEKIAKDLRNRDIIGSKVHDSVFGLVNYMKKLEIENRKLKTEPSITSTNS